MRLNKFIAQHTNYSRRAADELIEAGRIHINGNPVEVGQRVNTDDIVSIDGKTITANQAHQIVTIALNKPRGYVCSRNGQGSKTIYELLPTELQRLNPVGRLDKDSSGLLIMTTDGELAHQLTHPRYQKQKIYQVTLNKPLEPLHQQFINDHGIMLEDGISKLGLQKEDAAGTRFIVTMSEGRNRQIRRTFAALGYSVQRLHRIRFGPYDLATIELGTYRSI